MIIRQAFSYLMLKLISISYVIYIISYPSTLHISHLENRNWLYYSIKNESYREIDWLSAARLNFGLISSIFYRFYMYIHSFPLSFSLVHIVKISFLSLLISTSSLMKTGFYFFFDVVPFSRHVFFWKRASILYFSYNVKQITEPLNSIINFINRMLKYVGRYLFTCWIFLFQVTCHP